MIIHILYYLFSYRHKRWTGTDKDITTYIYVAVNSSPVEQPVTFVTKMVTEYCLPPDQVVSLLKTLGSEDSSCRPSHESCYCDYSPCQKTEEAVLISEPLVKSTSKPKIVSMVVKIFTEQKPKPSRSRSFSLLHFLRIFSTKWSLKISISEEFQDRHVCGLVDIDLLCTKNNIFLDDEQTIIHTFWLNYFLMSHCMYYKILIIYHQPAWRDSIRFKQVKYRWKGNLITFPMICCLSRSDV